MFRAPLCPSSGAREYYKGGCCLWCLVLKLSVWCGAEGYVSGLLAAAAPHHTDNLKTKAPNTTGSNHLYNTLEFLMMGIVVPETCWASNKICNKNQLLHPVGILFPHINDDVWSKSHQIQLQVCTHFWLLLACIRHRLLKKTFKLQRSILNILQFSSLYIPKTFFSTQVWSWDMITILILIF